MREMLKAVKLNCMIAKGVIIFLLVSAAAAGLTWRIFPFGLLFTLAYIIAAVLLPVKLAGKLWSRNYMMYDLFPVDYNKRIISMYLVNAAVIILSFTVLTFAVMIAFGLKSGSDISGLFTGFGKNGLDILSFCKKMCSAVIISLLMLSISLCDSVKLSKKAAGKNTGRSFNPIILIICMLPIFKSIFFPDFVFPFIPAMIIITVLIVFSTVKAYRFFTVGDRNYRDNRASLR